MLNGVEPVLIFQFKYKRSEGAVYGPENSVIGRIPLISQIPTFVDETPIPIYLSEVLTGLFIESDSKSLDANTDVETKASGADPDITQKGIANMVKVDLVATSDSVGVTLLSAMMDKIFDKLTSMEYSVTYLHGAVTVFRGLISSWNISQDTNTNKYSISLEISRGSKSTPKAEPGPPEVQKVTGTVPL